MPGTILVVDDRPLPRRALANELEDAGFQVIEAEDGLDGWERFRESAPDLVLSDLLMPRSDGLELLGRIRARSPVPVILFTAQATVDAAVSALKSGADEFVASSEVGPEALRELVASVLARGPRGPSDAWPDPLQGASPAMQRVRERLVALAPLREPVWLSGEPGSELIAAAQVLHALGGHPRAGFRRIVPGDAERADAMPTRGTLYLEHLDRFPAAQQARWAEWLRLRAADPADSPRPQPRVVASGPAAARATEDPGLHPALRERLLRFEVWIPPLRDRPEDIPRLARTLAEQVGRELGRPKHRFDDDALACLRAQHWAGNFVELRGFVEKAIAFSAEPRVGRSDVVALLAELRPSLARIRERHAAEEREELVAALERCGGNVTRTAEALGRSRASIYRLADKHGVALRRGPWA